MASPGKLGGVALPAGTVEIVLQPLINEAGGAIELGPPDVRRSLIARRNRKYHHLLCACT